MTASRSIEPLGSLRSSRVGRRGRLAELVRFRHLLRYLVWSNLRTESVNTTLGLVWWLLDPLLLMIVYTIFVGVILRRGGHDYPLFVLTAIISWEFFARATRKSMTMTLAKERSIRQVAFPRTVIPLAASLAEAIHFLFALGVLLVVGLAFGVHPRPAAALALPLAVLEFAFALGFAFFLAALNMFFRDTKHLTDHVYWLWFHLSPGLYTAAMIPVHYRHLFELNPFFTFFESFRSVLVDGRTPDVSVTHLGVLVGLSAGVLIVGYTYFIRAERSFAKVA